MKENIIVPPPNVLANANHLPGFPVSFNKGSLSVTPTNAAPLPAHARNKQPVPTLK